MYKAKNYNKSIVIEKHTRVTWHDPPQCISKIKEVSMALLESYDKAKHYKSNRLIWEHT